MSNLQEPLLVTAIAPSFDVVAEEQCFASPGDPHIIMARTNNKDGTASINVTTSTTHPNGYTDVKVELFEMPNSMESTIDEELGIIPKEYLSRVEYRVLPPGTLEEDDADDNTIYTHLTQLNGCDASTVRVSNLRKRRCPEWKRILFGSVILVVAWVLTAALFTDLSRESSSYSPEETSRSSEAATAAANATKLPESNETRTVIETDNNKTTEFVHSISYFAPVTISHLLGTHQRQNHLEVSKKSGM